VGIRFSIIIPTCNRPGPLRECLRRVLDQSAGQEVIVTDDGVHSPVPAGVHHLQGPRRGPAANRNHGARHAAGEWLIFLDDDCLPEPGWLDAYAAAANEGPDVMEGRTECPAPDAFAFDEIVENLAGGAYWSCNLAIRRDVFERLGGFDEDFTEAYGEDIELAWRMRSLRRSFIAGARVTHPVRRMDFKRLLRRTAGHRWMLLCRQKTEPASGGGPGSAARRLIVREYLDTLRLFRALLGERRRLRRRALEALWRWASLPWFLPYFLFWELRFRAKRAAGESKATSPAPPIR
jgi:GT2 family glycosyltransferase